MIQLLINSFTGLPPGNQMPLHSCYSILITMMILLTGCQTATTQDGPPLTNIDVSRIKNPTPKLLKKSKYGNPENYVALGKQYTVLKSAKGYNETGIASWYGTKFNGKTTSSGQPYNMLAMTGASKELPIPTYVEVTNLNNGKVIIVKINDRGPFHENRIIDLSYVAAKKLGILQKGTGLVRVEAIDPNTWHKPSASVPPSSAKLYLQLGAFSSAKRAISLKEELIQKGYLTTHLVKRHRTHGADFFVVIIGPLKSVSKADIKQSNLKLEGYQAISIVK
jgi:rare lipoprotein A